MKTSLLVLSCIVFGLSISFGQTKDGFKGYKWGTPFKEMKNGFQLERDEASSLSPYKQLNGEWTFKENMHPNAYWYDTNILYLDLPEYSMDVQFKFYQNSFCSVKIRTSGIRNILHLIEIWKKAYGKGIKLQTTPETKVEYYRWPVIGYDSQAELTRYIGGWTTSDGTEAQEYGELIYYSKSIDSLQYKKELEKGKW